MATEIVKRDPPFSVRLSASERRWIESTASEQQCSESQVIKAAIHIMAGIAGLNGWSTLD